MKITFLVVLFLSNFLIAQNTYLDSKTCEKDKYNFIGSSDVAKNSVYFKDFVNVTNGNSAYDLLSGTIFLKEEFKTGVTNTTAFSVYCRQNRMEVTSQISYDKDGNLKSKKTDRQIIRDIYPGTLLDFVFKYTCKCAKNS